MEQTKNSYKYILAFGSNVGNRHLNLSNSLNLLKKHLFITKQSAWRETKPLTHPEYDTNDHGNYVNFVCIAESNYKPDDLYHIIVEVEDLIGHPRMRRWMPRSLDIDILFCAEFDHKPFSKCKPHPFIKAPHFYVPHREYFNRDFWRDMVEIELKIPKEVLTKHFNTK